MREIGFVMKTEPLGGFYIFANARKFTKTHTHLLSMYWNMPHVGINPGIDFGSNGEGYVRFSYANSIENIKRGMNRLDRYLNGK